MIRSHLRLSGRPALFSALALAAVLGAPSPTAAQAADDLAAMLPAGSLRGEAALASLADQLDEVAAASHLTTESLRERLLTDTSLWVTPEGRLFFVDLPMAPRPDEEPAPASYAEDIPTSQAFLLHSHPGANKIIYLDFTGHHSVNNSWNHDIQFPPYNTSGGSATFSNGELNEIITWWKYVVEDYAPFDVDVTTEEPPLSALTKSGGGDQTWGIRCVMTQETGGFGGFGGIAFLNSFNDSIDNPVFVLNKGNNNGSMSASHEVGHSFGLSHDGLNSQSYHPGSGSGATSWGPIMGAPFGASLVQWSNGDYAGSTTTQNDVNIISSSSNGVNVQPDDHGDAFGAASPISAPVGCPVPQPGSATGIIETRNDVDAFFFTTTTSGEITVHAIPISPGGNLDIQLDLLDGSGVPLASANPATQTDASITMTLPAGTYTALIDGVGKSGSYSDYGCLGQYSIEVVLPNTDPLTILSGGVIGPLGVPPVLQALGTACPGNSISMNVFGAPTNTTAYLIGGLSELGVPFKGGVLWPDPNSGSIIPVPTGGGLINLSTTWPAGLPTPLTFTFQYWIPWANAPQGFSATDAARFYAP